MTIRTINCPNCSGRVDVEEDAMFGHCSFCGTSVMVEISGVERSYHYDPMKETYSKCKQLFESKNFAVLENFCDDVLREVDFDYICRFYKGVCLLKKEERTEAYDQWIEIFRGCKDKKLCKFLYDNICLQIVDIVFAHVIESISSNFDRVIGMLNYLERSMADCTVLEYDSGDLYCRLCDFIIGKGLRKTSYRGCLTLLRMFQSITDNVIFGRLSFERALKVINYILDTEKVFFVKMCGYHEAIKVFQRMENSTVPTNWGVLSYDDSRSFIIMGEKIDQNVCDLFESELMFTDYLLSGLMRARNAYIKKGIDLPSSLNLDDFRETSHFKAYIKAHDKINMSFTDKNPKTSLVIEESMKLNLNEYLSWYMGSVSVIPDRNVSESVDGGTEEKSSKFSFLKRRKG